MSSESSDIPEGFRMTELGPLPEDWAAARLGELFAIKQGKALSPEHRRGISPRPFLRTANVFWGYLNLANIDSMDFTDTEVSQLKLMPNDLLVCEGGDIGRTAIWSGQVDVCLYQNHLHRLRTTRNDVHPLFYMYWMQVAYLLLRLYGGTGNKTTIPNLSQSRLKSFILPLPPLLEQKAIARVLSSIQKVVETEDKIIAAARELKKSLMRHLFTYGPVPVVEAEGVPLKETEIGPMPEHWGIRQLLDTATLQRGKDLPKQNQIPGQYPIVGSSGVIGYHNEFVCSGPGVVTGRSGSIGNLAYVEEDYWPHNTGLYVKDFHGNNPKFIYYLLHLVDFRKYSTGVSVPTLNRNFVHSALVPVPPTQEQQQIAYMLTSMDKKIEAEEGHKAALQSLFRTMLHNLMTGKVRVKDLGVTAS
jgi:type I restriction enzyme S subunit